MKISFFTIKAYKRLFTGLLVCFFVYSLQCQDITLIVPNHYFHYKPVHSFQFYLNNAIYPKAKFTNQSPANQGWDPVVSYGAEWTIGYNLTFPSGFGFSLDAIAASAGHRFKERATKFAPSDPVYRALFNPFFGQLDYLAFSAKLSYIRNITPFLCIQPNVGLKFPYYIGYDHNFYSEFVQDNKIKNNYMHFSTDDCKTKFFPDFITDIDFLFHTKRNPRSNFILGVNLNLGFTPRFKGYYSITPPFTEKDCDITIGSTFFGINFGYQFIGLPKTYNRKPVRQERRKRIQSENCDFNQPVHSFGFVVNIGGNYSYSDHSYTQDADQDYLPCLWGYTTSLFVSDFTIKYNCAIKKGWGIGIDIPIGMMLKSWEIDPPFALCKTDTLFFDNTIVELSKGVSQIQNYRFPYSGLAIMASYMAPIHSRMLIHPEIGIKFVPFLKNKKINDVKAIVDDPREGYPPNVEYATVKMEIPRKNNAVPDIFVALNFLVHGKKNIVHNFVFGVNAQICFVNRITVSYKTTDVIPMHSQSSGWVNFNSSSFGLHLGYMFNKKSANKN